MPTKTPPATATAIPASVAGLNRSRKRSAEPRATNSGLVLTKTTELITDVESSEVVQKPK
jgi:hypothetical protein